MLSKESEQMELDNVGEPTIQGVNSSCDPLHSYTFNDQNPFMEFSLSFGEYCYKNVKFLLRLSAAFF